jgi:hypothetical protein
MVAGRIVPDGFIHALCSQADQMNKDDSLLNIKGSLVHLEKALMNLVFNANDDEIASGAVFQAMRRSQWDVYRLPARKRKNLAVDSSDRFAGYGIPVFRTPDVTLQAQRAARCNDNPFDFMIRFI